MKAQFNITIRNEDVGGIAVDSQGFTLTMRDPEGVSTVTISHVVINRAVAARAAQQKIETL